MKTKAKRDGNSLQKVTALIVPGFGEDIHNASYRKIIHFFKDKRIHAELVHITWKHNTISDFILQVMKECRKHSKSRIYLMGYSYGAFIAFLTAPFIGPHRLFLCSPSPFFKEDVRDLEPSLLRFLGKRRLKEIQKISLRAWSKFIPPHAVITVGSEEHPQVVHRAKHAHQLLRGSLLRIVRGADHKLNDPAYIKTIKTLI